MICILHVLFVILLQTIPAFAMRVEVLAGDSTFLWCSNLTTLTWRHIPLGEKQELFVYINDKIEPQYKLLGFHMETRQDGQILVIENVTTNLSGKYECEDVNDERPSIELIVLGEMPESVKQKLENDASLSASEHQLNQFGSTQKPALEEGKWWTPTGIALLVLGVFPYFAIGCYFLLRMVRRRRFAGERLQANEVNNQADV